MIEPVTQRPQARVDLLEQFVYFGEETSVSMAERYFSAVDETCLLLVKQPRMGTLHESNVPELTEMRKMPVRGFENHLILDSPRPGGIDVIRVVHGARHLDDLFGAEDVSGEE